MEINAAINTEDIHIKQVNYVVDILYFKNNTIWKSNFT